jgi:hypothetical protein
MSDGLGSSMLIEIGQVEAIFRYPVKSMRGERIESANLGWHGLEGDRRMAFQRIDNHSGMPWLTASNLPELLLFTPQCHEDGVREGIPTHIRTPEGQEMPVFAEAPPNLSSPPTRTFIPVAASNQSLKTHSARILQRFSPIHF